MNKKRFLSILLFSMMVLLAALPAFARGGKGTVSDENRLVSDNGSLIIEAQPIANQSGSATGIATIEANPSRLASPGTVTVTVKLRNVGNLYGGSLGDEEGSFAAQPGSHSQSAPLPTEAASISPVRPTDVPVVPTETPTETPSDPIAPTIAPIETPVPTPTPRPGRFTHINISNAYNAVFETSDVEPGRIGVFSTQMMVYETMIGQTLSFTITWYDTGAERTYYQQLALIIQRSDTAYLRLTRTASATNAAIGDEVKFVYTVVNTGTRRLNMITVVDDKIAGTSPIAEPFSLASGEKREIVYTYTMKGASVVSKPTATFVPDGSSTPLSVTVAKITVGLVTAQLTKNVTVGTPTPEGVAFTLFLTNNGSQNLTSLSVKDDLDNTLLSGFSLAIGESKIIEHFVANPTSVRNVVFYITGIYDADKEFSDNTTSYTVRPYLNPDLLGIRFTGEVRKQLDGENNIGLTFTVKNTGKIAYSNIILTEKELGYNIHEIPSLAPNSDPVSFNVDIRIDEPRELVFYLTALDPSGNVHTNEVIINAAHSDLDPAIPNATPDPQKNDPSAIDPNVERHIGSAGEKLLKLWNTLKIVFFVLLAFVVLLGAIEIYLFIRARRAS